MRLEASDLKNIESMKKEDPVFLYLKIKPGENVQNVLFDLKSYEARNVGFSGSINTLIVRVPAKNLKTVLERDYVERYEHASLH